MTKAEAAVNCFKQGCSCSQAILSTFGPELGLENRLCLKVSSAFGGGMARLGETCGVVTGALMVIGLRYGSTQPGPAEAKERSYQVSREFVARFTQKHKSILCRELLGCDISTGPGLQFARENSLFVNECPKYVATAAEILEELVGNRSP
mgnify:CR=1 FL=1